MPDNYLGIEPASAIREDLFPKQKKPMIFYSNTPYVLSNLASLSQEVNAMNYVQSDDYINNQVDNANSVINESIGTKPFVFKDRKIKVREDLSEIPVTDNDPLELQATKQFYNTIVKHKGIPSPTFMERSVNGSMTNSWYKMFSGKNLSNDLGYLDMTKDGQLEWDGKKLSLNSEQSKLLSFFFQKNSGSLDELSFWDHFGITLGSLITDIPLMAATAALTGGIGTGLSAGGEALGSTVLSNSGRLLTALQSANTGFGRYFGQALFQAANFNLMGLPQTIKSDNPYAEIYHNTWMGALAGVSAGLGQTVSRGLVNKVTTEVIKKNPAIMEEMGAAASSFGFGYLSTTIGGGTGQQGLATGLAFMATHFANPKTYQRVINDSRSYNIAELTRPADLDPSEYRSHYFDIDKTKNRAYQIDDELFMKSGEVRRIEGVNPLDISGENSKSLKYIWEKESENYLTFRDALTIGDIRKGKDELMNNWKKDLSPDYYKENVDRLSVLAQSLSAQAVLNKKVLTFKRNQPEVFKDFKIRNEITDLANQYHTPVGRIEHYIESNFADHVNLTDKKLEEYRNISEYGKEYTTNLMDRVQNTINDNTKRKALEIQVFGKQRPPEEFTNTLDSVLKASNELKDTQSVADVEKVYSDYYNSVDLMNTRSMETTTTEEAGKKVAKEKFKEVLTKEELQQEELRKKTEEDNKQRDQIYKAMGEASKEMEKEIKPFEGEPKNLTEFIAKNFIPDPENDLNKNLKQVKKLEKQWYKQVETKDKQQRGNKIKYEGEKEGFKPEPKVEKIKLEDLAKAQTQELKTMTEEEAIKHIQTIDKYLEREIPDAEKRAEAKHTVEGRGGLPKDLTDILLRRDIINTRKHELTAERRALANKDILDLSNVATPENRRKLLARGVRPERNPSEFSMKEEGRSYELKLRKAIKDNESIPVGQKFQNLASRMNLPRTLTPLWEMLDKFGVNFSKISKEDFPIFQENMGHYLSQENLIQLNKKYFGSSDDAVYNREIDKMTPEEMLTKVLVHESIHAVTLQPEFKEIYDNEIAPYLGKFYDRLKEYIDQDKAVLLGEDVGINPVINHVLNALKDSSINPHTVYAEVVTHALTEPDLARYLDHIPAVEQSLKNAPKTLWDNILDWIRSTYEKVIGVPKSMMDELIDNLNSTYLEKGLFEKTVETSEITPISENIAPQPLKENIEQPLKPIEQKTDINISPKKINGYKTIYGNDLTRKIEDVFPSISKSKDRPDEDIDKNQKSVSLEKLKSYSEVQAEMQLKNMKDTRDSGLYPKGKEMYDTMMKDGVFFKVKHGLVKYLDLNLPPVFYAEMSSKFKDNVYQPGEEFIRMNPYQINRIIRDIDNWNSGSKFHKLLDIKGMSGLTGEIKISPEGQHFLDAIKSYEYGRYTGSVPKDLTWNEFADWAKFSGQQKEVLDVMKKAQRQAIDRMKEMKIRFMVDFDRSITHLTDEEIVRNFVSNYDELAKGGRIGKEGSLPYEDAQTSIDKYLNEHLDLKEQIAKYIIEDKYKGWGDRFHYNSIRPADPNTIMIEASKSGIPGERGERISTYFDNWTDANTFMEQAKTQGYRITEQYKIKDLISPDGSYMGGNKLTAHQIMELANAGHINLNEDVIQRLLDATKRGVDLHQIDKEYIPGMKYTAKEFENQLERFVREAITGSYKSYYLTKIQRNLLDWESQLTPLIKSGKFKDKVTSAKQEYEYGQRYLNQLKQPEKTVVDKLRGIAMTWQIGGLKPAFLWQQTTQIFQGTFHQSIADMKLAGGGVGDTIKAFNNAAMKAVKANMALRMYKEGLEIPKDFYTATDGSDLTPELMEHLKRLDYMRKIEATGITELTSEMTEKDFQYATGWEKFGGAANRVMTYLGKGVEKWTRTQTALTYFEIGKKMGLKDMELTNFIATGIDKGMSEWGKGGRAPLFDSKNPNTRNSPLVNALKKSFMTYKTFTFYNYGMYRTLFAKRQYDALASKIIIGAGMHGIAAFPFMATMMAVGNLFTDDDIDYEMWKLSDELDKIVPFAGGILHRGVGSVVGADLRQMYGEDTPLASDLWAEAWSKSWESKLLEIGLGAPLGFTKTTINALSVAKDELWKSVSDSAITTEADQRKADKIMRTLSPVFIKNIFDAFRFERDGIEVNGKQMIVREDLSSLDIALKALSFAIGKQTRAYKEYDAGPEAEYNKYQQILKTGSTHRKELLSQGVSQDIIDREMIKVANAMQEARTKLAELEPKVRDIKRMRRLSELNK
jgi:hypothetical protein